MYFKVSLNWTKYSGSSFKEGRHFHLDLFEDILFSKVEWGNDGMIVFCWVNVMSFFYNHSKASEIPWEGNTSDQPMARATDLCVRKIIFLRNWCVLSTGSAQVMNILQCLCKHSCTRNSIRHQHCLPHRMTKSQTLLLQLAHGASCSLIMQIFEDLLNNHHPFNIQE